jgi:4-amino-4-deoxy-L-arabinose transferase-like glycosyltransferase
MSSEPKYEVDTTFDRLALVIVGLVGLLRFIHLDFIDLQAWDEALYAVRAEGILRFGGWLDQSGFAIDGLYSALHPPLYVWLTSLSFAFLGVNEFSARLVSAVFGGATLFVIYLLGKRLHSAPAGLWSALLFGLNPFVTFFARQGQFDAALTFFLVLGASFLIRVIENERTIDAFLSGLFVGAALMTKLYVGFGMTITYFFWIVTMHPDRSKHWRHLLLHVIGLVLVAAPWHILMTIQHGDGNPFFFFQASAIIERSLSGVEGNVKPLEVFYFVNQLLVLFPVGVVWFMKGLWETARAREPRWWLLALWFIFFFIVFSLVRTKLAVYLLPMLVPAALLAGRTIQDTIEGKLSPVRLTQFIVLTALIVLWSASQTWRNAAKSALLDLARFSTASSDNLILLIPLGLATLFGLLLLVVARKRPLLEFLRRPLPYLFFFPLLLLNAYEVGMRDRWQYRDGATELAELIETRKPTSLLVAGYERNPQLTYYLDGIDIGWRDDIGFRRIVPPKSREEFRTWLTVEASQEPTDGLIIVEKDKFIRYEWITAEEVMPQECTLLLDSRRYAVFSRTPSIQYAEKTERTVR